MRELVFDDVHECLLGIASRTPVTRLRPEAFFVARAGVLTLAYRGFPRPLLDLKSDTVDAIPGIPEEAPGSRWPKTTLAALVERRPLSTEEIVLLREATHEGTICLSRNRRGIPVDVVELVELRCRSMEEVGRRETLPLEGGDEEGRIPIEHRSEVNEVLTQWRREGLSRYVPDLTRQGHRERHYREALRELSLIVPVGGVVPCMRLFRDAVERRLPGRYAWFAEESLHVTLRSLGPIPDHG